MRQRITSLMRPHSRWTAILHDVVGGQAPPDAERRFSVHAATCARCSADLEALRGLRAALAALPDHDAPRPFRIDARMVAARAADEAAATVTATAPGRGSWSLRLAQGVAAMAVFSFTAVVAADVVGNVSNGSGTDEHASMTRADELSNMAAESAGAGTAGAPLAAGAAAPGSAAAQPGGSAAPAATLAPENPGPEGSPSPGSVGAQAAPPTPTAAATTDPASAPSPPRATGSGTGTSEVTGETPTPTQPQPPSTGPGPAAAPEMPRPPATGASPAYDTGRNGYEAPAPADAAGVPPPVTTTGLAATTDAADEGDGISRLRAAEAGLAAIALAAFAAVFILNRTRNHRST